MKQRWPVWLAGLVILLLLGVAYSRSFTVPFFFDDRLGILENDSIRHLTDWARTFWAPPEAAGATGRPLVNASLALNYALGGEGVAGYHVFNLLIHAVATLLLFGVVRRTLEAWWGDAAAGWSERRSFWAALAVAAVWGAHPLLSESVICAIQRDEVMVGAAMLASLYCFIRGWRVAAIAAGFTAVLCKEVAVGLPILILAYDRTFLAGSFRAVWHARRATYLALFSSWLVLGLLALGTRHRGGSAGFGLGVSSWSYLLTQCRALEIYLRLSLWPHPLVLDYGTGLASSLSAVLPQALLIVVLLGFTAFAFFSAARPRQALGFLGVWFFVILAPSSSVVPLVTQTIAEHRMYLSLAAVVALAVVGAFAGLRSRRAPIVGAGFALLALVAAVATRARSADYQDELGLWKQTAAAWPANPRVFMNLGTVSSWRGDQAGAVGYFTQSLELDPNAADTRFNLAVALSRAGHPVEAEAQFRRSLQLDATLPVVHYEFGRMLLDQGRFDESIAQVEAALSLRPESPASRSALAKAHFMAGNAEAKRGRLADSLLHFEAALALQPDYPEALNNYGNALSALGRHREAIATFQTSIRLHPDQAEAHYNLAAELVDAGRFGEARAELAEVIRLRPDDREARDDLAHLPTGR